MSWDIYGNPLRRGHCEVHPHIAEEYPCCVCLEDRRQYAIERNRELEQPSAEPYEALFAAAMNTAEQAMDYVQNNPDKFDARPGDDKLAIVCREFLKAQQPTPDVEDARLTLKAMQGRGLSPGITMTIIDQALAAHRKQGGDL